MATCGECRWYLALPVAVGDEGETGVSRGECSRYPRPHSGDSVGRWPIVHETTRACGEMKKGGK